MTRYIVDIDVDPEHANDDRAVPALEWVTSVFTAGGLRTVVDDAVVRIIGQGTRNRVLEVHARHLLEPDLAMQRAELARILVGWLMPDGDLTDTIERILEVFG